MTDEVIAVELAVSQEAREAAIAHGILTPGFAERNGYIWSAEYLIRRGEWDDHPAVQAFARFETQARLAALRAGMERDKALLAVVSAVRDYLPPDGIDAQECLNRIIGATDNPTINSHIAEIENGAL